MMPQKYSCVRFEDQYPGFLVASSLPKGKCPKGVTLEQCPLCTTLKQDSDFHVETGLSPYGDPCVIVQVPKHRVQGLTIVEPHPILLGTYKNIYEVICVNCQKQYGSK
jgi:hypothetical protein